VRIPNIITDIHWWNIVMACLFDYQLCWRYFYLNFVCDISYTIQYCNILLHNVWYYSKLYFVILCSITMYCSVLYWSLVCYMGLVCSVWRVYVLYSVLSQYTLFCLHDTHQGSRNDISFGNKLWQILILRIKYIIFKLQIVFHKSQKYAIWMFLRLLKWINWTQHGNGGEGRTRKKQSKSYLGYIYNSTVYIL